MSSSEPVEWVFDLFWNSPSIWRWRVAVSVLMDQTFFLGVPEGLGTGINVSTSCDNGTKLSDGVFTFSDCPKCVNDMQPGVTTFAF